MIKNKQINRADRATQVTWERKFVDCPYIHHMTTIMFCYAHVMKVIRNVKDDNSSITNSFNKLTDIKRTFKKVLTYILVFILPLSFMIFAYF